MEDHDHHHMTTTDSTPGPSPPTADHASHHSHHIMTFQLWTASSLLLRAWRLDTVHGLVTGIMFCCVLSVVYEGSKFYYHIGKILHSRKSTSRWQGTLVAHYVSRMWKALAYTIHFLIGYILMLCTMTYNVWLVLAVCLGAGIGYFFLLPLIVHVLNKVTDEETRAVRANTTPVTRCSGESDKSDSAHSSETDSIRRARNNENDSLLEQISVVRETEL
ncbi:protein SLC31A2-like isoform X1 [Haliotis asinina]|uniref:protein SLC31A2-like isoform X1 n=1 Tax=Haliotis asinina TaxID=109174 RepID=UPI0035327A1E